MGGGCVFVIGYAGMPILLSFFVCLSCECIFSCFYQTPSLLCLSLLASLCMCVYLCVRVCLCLSMSFFPSLPLFLSFSSSFSVFLSVAVPDSCCLHLRGNSTGASAGKVLPLPCSTLLSSFLHHRVKLASLSFFLYCSCHPYSFSPYHFHLFSFPPLCPQTTGNHLNTSVDLTQRLWFVAHFLTEKSSNTLFNEHTA